MPPKRSGLGRGLAELLGEPAVEAKNDGSRVSDGVISGIVELSVGSVRPNPRQPRRDMDRESLEELARSMQSLGVVQPIIVRPLEEGYELIAGERRWRAAQLAGFTVVPAIVRPASDVESLEIALVENVMRRALNPVDEAYALQVLLDDLGSTQEALAGRLGRSRPALSNKLRLLELPKEVQDLLAQGALSEGHGRALLGLRARGDQVKLARRAAARGLSVRAVEAEVRRALSAGSLSTPPPASLPGPELTEPVRAEMHRLLGVWPRITWKAGGGRIEVPFATQKELELILRRLSGK
ncbi:MAG: ParB/RepB/Spo0J family partition protein [Gaiellales bacterium]|nr:ParB/RepB/Spo0J family partition protein [Gaiellales bacterium]